jgi:hypothetical protein
MVSLLLLLKRVKWEERVLRGASKKSLLTIAECVLGNAYSRQEYDEAIMLLAKYRLTKLVDRRRPIRCRQLIEKERKKPYRRRCARCGLIIIAEKSLQIGYGPVCRKKVGATSLRASANMEGTYHGW